MWEKLADIIRMAFVWVYDRLLTGNRLEVVCALISDKLFVSLPVKLK